jgi:hypothetical protein
MEETMGLAIWREIVLLVFIGVINFTTAGCGTIPDLEPYAQSTAALHSAASSSHDVVYKELSALARLNTEDTDFAEFPKTFSKAWQPRLHIMAAMVAYSDSLAAIAQAANDGHKNTKALAESLGAFVASVGGPYGIAASGATQIVGSLASAAIQISAANKIEEAISAADPVIQEVSDLIVKDFAELEKLLAKENLESTLEAAIKRSYTTEFGADPGYRKRLIQLQKDARAKIHEERQTVPLNPTNLKEAEDRLSQLNDWLGATNQWHDKQESDLREMQARFASQRLVLGKTMDGIREWRAIHKNLAVSMKEGKQRPNYRLLYNTAMEIQTILKEGK